MKRIAILTTLLLIVGGGAAGVYFYAAGTDSAETAPGGTAEDATPANGAPSEKHAESPDGEAEEGTGAGEEEEGETAVPVKVVEVESGSISTYLTAVANLVPEHEVKVLAEAEGRVTRLLVEEGDRVQSGQLLATLLRDEAEIAFNKAEVKAQNAKMAFDRGKRMHGENLIAQEDYDKLAMEHRIAEQELAEAEWRLDKTEIRSPFDGRLTLRNVTPGQHIRPGEELFTVTDFDPLIARIYLPEKDVLDLEEGRKVKITLKADESVVFRGSIRQISPVVDTATGTVKVTVAAIEPPQLVRPGGFVTIDIVRETRDDTVVLPREAVVRELQSAHVFVAVEEVAERRAVKLGLEENGRLEILSGVSLGESVVIAGQGSLKDGSQIKILETTTDDKRAVAEINSKRRLHG